MMVRWSQTTLRYRLACSFNVGEKETGQKILGSSIINHLLLRGLIFPSYCSLFCPHFCWLDSMQFGYMSENAYSHGRPSNNTFTLFIINCTSHLMSVYFVLNFVGWTACNLCEAGLRINSLSLGHHALIQLMFVCCQLYSKNTWQYVTWGLGFSE